jgi:hypothetical protein
MTEPMLTHNLDQVGVQGPGWQLFWRKWLENPRWVNYQMWFSEADKAQVFEDLPPGLHTIMGEQRQDRLIEVDGMTIYVIWHWPNQWSFTLAGDEDQCMKYLASLKDRIPEIKNDNENVIPIAFWALNAKHDPEARVRQIESHRWANIRDNYEMGVRTRLDELMDVSPPEGSGKLVLWHGPPGTGKTNCIRALAHSWRKWCDVDYIVDPEELFGHAHYMMNCLVNGRNTEDRWRLVVIEDSGEFLKKDAKAQAGQSFGRLLNLTDGLVGQGLRLILLITTNEPFGDLHPAISRPGRCLSHLEFGPFPPDEATKWLGRTVVEDMTLADLYEARSEMQPQITKEKDHYRPGMYV